MAVPYEYIQIITDNDWGLVEIIPPNPSNDRIKQLPDKSTIADVVTAKVIPEIVKLRETDPSIPRSNPIPINREPKQRPKIITRRDDMITQASYSERNIYKSGEIGKSEGTFKSEGVLKNMITTAESNMVLSDTINSLSGTMKSRPNVLVGFGK